jgi:hypothetical protein
MPKNDGTCPSCGAATAGAAAVAIAPGDPAEAAAWRHYEEEQRARRETARRLRDRGGQLTWAGVGLATVGILVSVGSFVSAGPGGSFIVWTGAVIVGAGLIVRGRGLVARANTLEDR